MAAFGASSTSRINYSGPIDAARIAERSFTQRVYRYPEYGPDARHYGTMTNVITTAASLTAVTDGTLATNAAAQTFVTMTYTEGHYTASILPSQLRQFGEAEVASHFRAAMYAQILAVETALLTATTTGYMAATPGSSVTLPAGQQNFTCAAYTDAQVGTALNALDQGVAYVLAQSGNDFENTFIILPRVSWHRLRTLVNMKIGNGLTLNNNGWLEYAGIPIYMSRSTTTGWGGTSAGHTAGIVAHRDSAAAAFGEPYLWGGGPEYVKDGTLKYMWMCPYATGIVQNLWFEILNSSC